MTTGQGAGHERSHCGQEGWAALQGIASLTLPTHYWGLARDANTLSSLRGLVSLNLALFKTTQNISRIRVRTQKSSFPFPFPEAPHEY